MTREVTMQGKPLRLEGKELKVGDKAPDFTLMDNGFNPVRLSDSKGKARLISVVPSLETSLCSLQTRTFNEKLKELGEAFTSYTVSVDLPFAQKRYVDENKISNTILLSDYRTVSFGQNYGLLIGDLRLLTRAVLVVDQNDMITYMQVMPEVSNEPDYDSALEALKKIIG